MALKRHNQIMAAFSMASMTDVIFLLLIFFMVTSTFVFPTALEISLPESSEQTPGKPSARIYIDAQERLYATYGGSDAEPAEMLSADQLLEFLKLGSEDAAADFIAVYADESVTYGRLVEVLDLGARHNLKMVLATKPAPSSARPVSDNP